MLRAVQMVRSEGKYKGEEQAYGPPREMGGMQSMSAPVLLVCVLTTQDVNARSFSARVVRLNMRREACPVRS